MLSWMVKWQKIYQVCSLHLRQIDISLSSVVPRGGPGAICLPKVIDGPLSLAHGVQMTLRIQPLCLYSKIPHNDHPEKTTTPLL